MTLLKQDLLIWLIEKKSTGHQYQVESMEAFLFTFVLK